MTTNCFGTIDDSRLRTVTGGFDVSQMIASGKQGSANAAAGGAMAGEFVGGTAGYAVGRPLGVPEEAIRYAGAAGGVIGATATAPFGFAYGAAKNAFDQLTR